MTSRARISDAELQWYEDQIARQNRILRRTQDIMRQLDPDSLTHLMGYFTEVMEAAKMTKETLIAEMNAAKEAAQNGRA